MICPACARDSHPVVEGDQNGRFVYTCAFSDCHSFIKLHERSEPKPAVAKLAQAASAIPSGDEHIASPEWRPAAATPATNADGLAATAAARLLAVEADIARLESLKVERSRLRAMVRASERRPRAAKSNVVHIAAKKAAQ